MERTVSETPKMENLHFDAERWIYALRGYLDSLMRGLFGCRGVALTNGLGN